MRQSSFFDINLLLPMQDSIKQHNTFTTIAAAKVEVIASYRGCLMVLVFKLKSEGA